MLKQKHLSDAANSTSNLLKHLIKMSTKTDLMSKDPCAEGIKVTQGEIKRLVATYIVEEMLSQSTVYYCLSFWTFQICV